MTSNSDVKTAARLRAKIARLENARDAQALELDEAIRVTNEWQREYEPAAHTEFLRRTGFRFHNGFEAFEDKGLKHAPREGVLRAAFLHVERGADPTKFDYKCDYKRKRDEPERVDLDNDDDDDEVEVEGYASSDEDDEDEEDEYDSSDSFIDDSF